MKVLCLTSESQIYTSNAFLITDRVFKVIHTPGHSNDSICLYNSEEKVLFSGDTPLVIRSKDNTYEQNFIEALKYLSTKKVETIYFGHGPPLNHDCMEMISNIINNISIKGN
ncbi:MBL fold metallo-hydrolase [Acetivibrio cellulolyticus]|uniref:MBL fold metallo-hydrolase n=1 Tax=Acetivibrio cellulolyticus TaxID=35830 RepID=UPI0001E2D0FF|nr:MBL fold metallo-hydrolase [Acetivibrio cellulolyticus]